MALSGITTLASVPSSSWSMPSYPSLLLFEEHETGGYRHPQPPFRGPATPPPTCSRTTPEHRAALREVLETVLAAAPPAEPKAWAPLQAVLEAFPSCLLREKAMREFLYLRRLGRELFKPSRLGEGSGARLREELLGLQAVAWSLLEQGEAALQGHWRYSLLSPRNTYEHLAAAAQGDDLAAYHSLLLQKAVDERFGRLQGAARSLLEELEPLQAPAPRAVRRGHREVALPYPTAGERQDGRHRTLRRSLATARNPFSALPHRLLLGGF